MSNRKVFPGDTHWAIAGKVPASLLAKIGRHLPEWLHGDGHRVVTGKDGFAALLVFGGPADLGERPADELARRHGPVYLLDFDDEAYSIKELTGSKVKRLRGYPNELLEKHGIIAPGWEPSPPSPMITAGVVEGITPEEVRSTCPGFEVELAEHPRGVLLTGFAASSVALEMTIRRKVRSYAVYFNREDGDFSCIVRNSDGSDGCFAVDKPSPNYPPLDSILGETTMDGILRVLGIPRELFHDQRSPC